MAPTRLRVLDSGFGAGRNREATTLDPRSEYLAHLRRRGLSPNTIESYGIHLRCFRAWLGRPLLSATAADIEAFLDSRPGRSGGGINEGSRREWLSHLSCFYDWSRRAHGRPRRNPTEPIIRPPLRRRLPRPIAEDDLAQALTAAVGDSTMRAFLVLGAFAGFRCCEMAWLTGEAVLWHEGVLNVFGKGRKERVVEIHPTVAAALRTHGVPRSGPVFVHDGAPMLPRLVSRTICRFFDDHQINARPHQLRHRFATKAYAECKDLRVVQELLGHADPQTTAVYTQFARDAARAAVLAIPTPTFDAPTDEEAA